jgi:hypothetical protein
MSDNLRLLGKYSAAMESGDGEAVFEFFAPEFHSHVTETFAAMSNTGGNRHGRRSPI